MESTPKKPAEKPVWNSQLAKRRFALIQRDEYDGDLTVSEKEELESLQQQLDEHAESIAPTPFDALREARMKLLESLIASDTATADDTRELELLMLEHQESISPQEQQELEEISVRQNQKSMQE